MMRRINLIPTSGLKEGGDPAQLKPTTSHPSARARVIEPLPPPNPTVPSRPSALKHPPTPSRLTPTKISPLPAHPSPRDGLAVEAREGTVAGEAAEGTGSR